MPLFPSSHNVLLRIVVSYCGIEVRVELSWPPRALWGRSLTNFAWFFIGVSIS